MAILIYSSKTDHDLIYYVISLDNTEYSFVSVFWTGITSGKEVL